MDYQKILSEILQEIQPLKAVGTVANYIPELAKTNPDKFGISIITLEGVNYAVGDVNEKFSIQSISKVLSLALAMDIIDKNIWERVDVEPSGTPFNSLVQLEYEKGIPRNPYINSGAIVVADILVSYLAHPKKDFLDYINRLTGCDTIAYNETIAASELSCGYRNAALAYLLKSFNNLHNDVDVVLDLYFHMCAIEMTCEELAKCFMVFANNGKRPETGKQIVNLSHTKRINALMQTCGFYDESGEFSFEVGLPGKSGVGGGIAAVHPGKYSVAVWGPRLNKKGNSVMGMRALELLTTKTGLSIF